MIDQDQLLVRNSPIPVNFAGLRGNTREMQSNGWELAIEKQDYAMTGMIGFRVAGRHSGLGLRILSGVSHLDRGLMAEIFRGLADPSKIMAFDIRICADAITMVVPQNSAPRFHAVDFGQISCDSVDMGQMINSLHRDIDDLVFFQPNNESADIYVPEKKIWTLQEQLEEILDTQKEEQAELRERARKRQKGICDANGRISTTENLTGNDVKLRLLLA